MDPDGLMGPGIDVAGMFVTAGAEGWIRDIARPEYI